LEFCLDLLRDNAPWALRLVINTVKVIEVAFLLFNLVC